MLIQSAATVTAQPRWQSGSIIVIPRQFDGASIIGLLFESLKMRTEQGLKVFLRTTFLYADIFIPISNINS